jgi:two-component system chemotaxis sensor kinase CheA
MNDDLLVQFIGESRELLVEAQEDLLALERAPDDRDRIHRLFRSIHTVKGSSCLFDIPPITRVLHAGEDLFQAVREHGLALTPEMVDAALGALDLASRWIDELEQNVGLPAAAAGLAADAATRLRGYLGPAAPMAVAAVVPPAEPPPALADWFDAATLTRLSRHPGALHLIIYRPADSCFFKGEDPLYLALQTPGLAALACAWAAVCAPLQSFDPYHCNLVFYLIADAPLQSLNAHLRYVAQDSTVALLPPGSFSTAPIPRHLPEVTHDLLRFSADMLRQLAPAAEQPGRLASARRVAANALGTAGFEDAAAALAEAATADALVEAIGAILARDTAAAAAPASAASTPAAEQHPEAAHPEAAHPEAMGGRKMLRVDQEKIDMLMKLVGELVVAKNSLPYLARRADEQYGARALGREIKDEYGVIDRIVQELQGAVMSVRMMPVGQVFQRFPRLVRDLARKLGKQVDLVITGEETEADKNVIESLFDPLLHMVRNSLDHGIEPPAEREACGKPRTATLTLAARQDGDQAVVEIIDDGRGIDPEAIKRKAYARGLIDETRLNSITDQDAAMLIFAVGFSTAEQVSDVSGRGVGMDVVRAAVEKAGGAISLSSAVHCGTTLRLSLPLSMAVTRVMTVRLGERLFGIPMDAVLETVKLPREKITRIKSAEAFVLREAIVPLRHLTRLLELPENEDQAGEVAVLVVRVAGQLVGLGISAFGEVMEVILKPLDGALSRITGYCGTCLLGDGKVLLVLDLKGLIA